MQSGNQPDPIFRFFLAIKKYSVQYALNVVIFIIVSAFFIYIYIVIRKDKNNCKNLETPMNTNIVPLLTNTKMKLSTITLNQTFIKTAYNCCCSGQFKNDYVNYCALINCAKQGVRALDFTVYSLKGRPIIAASTLTSNDYKETYNSLPFADTMAQVYQYFVASNMNCPNTSDPLFLIFRVQSLLKKTYDDMASAINSSFGDNSLNGNMIFYLNGGDRTLDNTLLSSLTNDKVQGCKVVIIVDVSGMQKDFYRKSKLSLMSALDIGNGDNIIHRESDLVQKPDMDGLSASTLSFLYPDFSNTSNNYNFVNGLNYKINFIGLSFQTNDLHLKVYNDMFSNSSIITVENPNVKTLINGIN
jgi:hypothetical protein